MLIGSGQRLLRLGRVNPWSYCAPARGVRVIVDQRDHTIVAFDQGRAALDPVTTIVISDSAEFADRCVMDVATQHGIDVIPLRVMRHSGFEFTDEAHGVLYRSLGICTEGPVAQTEMPPDKVN